MKFLKIANVNILKIILLNILLLSTSAVFSADKISPTEIRTTAIGHGSTGNLFDQDIFSSWGGGGSHATWTLTFNLGEVYELAHMNVFWGYIQQVPTEFSIEVSLNNKNWKTLEQDPDLSNRVPVGNTARTDHDLLSTKAQYVRFNYSGQAVYINEIELIGKIGKKEDPSRFVYLPLRGSAVNLGNTGPTKFIVEDHETKPSVWSVPYAYTGDKSEDADSIWAGPLHDNENSTLYDMFNFTKDASIGYNGGILLISVDVKLEDTGNGTIASFGSYYDDTSVWYLSVGSREGDNGRVSFTNNPSYTHYCLSTKSIPKESWRRLVILLDARNAHLAVWENGVNVPTGVNDSASLITFPDNEGQSECTTNNAPDPTYGYGHDVKAVINSWNNDDNYGGIGLSLFKLTEETSGGQRVLGWSGLVGANSFPGKTRDFFAMRLDNYQGDIGALINTIQSAKQGQIVNDLNLD